MKKICLLLLFLCAAFPLNAWVFLDSVEKDGSGWLLPKMLSDQPVRVCVDVLDSPQNGQQTYYTGPQRAAYYAMSAQIVYSAYQNWFDNVREQIRLSERKKEFKDLLAFWPKKAPIQFINISPSAKVYKSCRDYALGEVDLRVRATLYEEAAQPPEQGVVSFRLQPDNTGLMDTSGGAAGPSSLAAALRQTGYTLGLADYAAVKEGFSSPVYAFKDSAVPTGARQTAALTCDEAEGLVNLADFFSTKPSPRAQTGWLGFCPGRSVVYAQGMAVPVSAEQAAAQETFVEQGRQGPAPLSASISAAVQKAARYQRVKAAEQQKQKEKLQRQVVQTITSHKQP